MENRRATGRVTDRCLHTGNMPSLPFKVACGVCWCKLLIFRRLSPIFIFFSPFLSCKVLVSRRLRVFPGLFICGRQSLHPLKWGIQNAETSASSVEPCGILTGAVLGYPTRSRLRFFWEEQGWAENGW